MRRINEMVCKAALGGIQYIGLAFTCILAIAGGFVTCYAESIGNQINIMKWDVWFIQIPLAVLCIAALAYLSAWIGKRRHGERILLAAVLLWVLFCCLYLVLFGRSAPSGDSFSVYDIAANFAWGYYHAVSSPESYLSFYPQQIGLIAFYEGIFRVCNALSVPVAVYHYIKAVNSLLVCLIVVFQWRMLKDLFPEKNSSIVYLLLVPFCFPIFFYSSFIYGEIPSVAMMTLAMWLTVKMCRKPSVLCGFLLALSAGAGVALRKNSLIFVIAACIVLFISYLHKREWQILVTLLAVAGCSVLILPCISSRYEGKADAVLSKGVSALSYVAMGMQDSASGPGAYNGFNFNTYLENQGDQEKMKQMSQAAIRDRQIYFKNHPREAVTFYTDKFLYQWTEGEYGSRQATAVDYGGRVQFMQDIYNGKWYAAFTEVTGFYQFLIYGGAFLFFLYVWINRAKEKQELFVYIGIIAVFGGFLFHMVWEAGSRYIFPYFIFLIPYAGMGIAESKRFIALKVREIRSGK